MVVSLVSHSCCAARFFFSVSILLLVFFAENQSGVSGPCKKLANNQIKSGLIGAYIPQCKPNGYFSALQCYGSTGTCWCVDEHNTVITGDAKKATECSKSFVFQLSIKT